MRYLVCVRGNFDPAFGLHPAIGEIVCYLKAAERPSYIVLREYQFAFDGREQAFADRCFREVDSSFGQHCEDVYLSIAQFEEAMKEVSI